MTVGSSAEAADIRQLGFCELAAANPELLQSTCKPHRQSTGCGSNSSGHPKVSPPTTPDAAYDSAAAASLWSARYSEKPSAPYSPAAVGSQQQWLQQWLQQPLQLPEVQHGPIQARQDCGTASTHPDGVKEQGNSAVYGAPNAAASCGMPACPQVQQAAAPATRAALLDAQAHVCQLQSMQVQQPVLWSQQQCEQQQVESGSTRDVQAQHAPQLRPHTLAALLQHQQLVALQQDPRSLVWCDLMQQQAQTLQRRQLVVVPPSPDSLVGPVSNTLMLAPPADPVCFAPGWYNAGLSAGLAQGLAGLSAQLPQLGLCMSSAVSTAGPTAAFALAASGKARAGSTTQELLLHTHSRRSSARQLKQLQQQQQEEQQQEQQQQEQPQEQQQQQQEDEADQHKEAEQAAGAACCKKRPAFQKQAGRKRCRPQAQHNAGCSGGSVCAVDAAAAPAVAAPSNLDKALPTSSVAATASDEPAAPASVNVIPQVCDIAGLLAVSTGEQAAERLAHMSRAELFRFAAQAVGSPSCLQSLPSTSTSRMGGRPGAVPTATPLTAAVGAEGLAQPLSVVLTPTQSRVPTGSEVQGTANSVIGVATQCVPGPDIAITAPPDLQRFYNQPMSPAEAAAAAKAAADAIAAAATFAAAAKVRTSRLLSGAVPGQCPRSPSPHSSCAQGQQQHVEDSLQEDPHMAHSAATVNMMDSPELFGDLFQHLQDDDADWAALDFI